MGQVADFLDQFNCCYVVQCFLWWVKWNLSLCKDKIMREAGRQAGREEGTVGG